MSTEFLWKFLNDMKLKIQQISNNIVNLYLDYDYLSLKAVKKMMIKKMQKMSYKDLPVSNWQ